MIVQFNTDKTINGDEKSSAYFTGLIEDGLKRFSSQITRIEVHLSDENGKKEGPRDIRCLMEARLEGRKPIAISSNEGTEEQAISEAIERLRTSIETTLEKASDH
ncbi:MAG: HPF/RaiA family ribosome-associated protein [Bacteroidota bacterium]|nr:HPF/RaiA family ribosome-associated protein [Bacteroidota bacterium]